MTKILSYRPCESLSDLIINDEFRYQQKGYHIITSAIMMFSFFYFGPNVMHVFWKLIIPLGQWKSVYLVLNIIFPLVSHLFNNLFYFAIYRMKHPLIEKYRILQQPWPWEKSKDEWIPFRNRLIKYTSMNLIMINISLVVIEYLQGVDHYNYAIENLPSKSQYFLQIVFFMITEDFFFYFSHRFFHWKPVYRFHKIHHEHYNAFSCTVSYTHPVDYFFGSILPFVSGFKILGYRSHFSVYIFWQLWRLLETYDGHCGYEFPWAMFRLFPFSGSSDYHNFHHSKNMGNFSSFFTYLDSIFKTNKDYLLYKQSQKQIKVQ
ncbi:hypothetical protein ABPG72_021465 [Tetrahymena utriculariae]